VVGIPAGGGGGIYVGGRTIGTSGFGATTVGGLITGLGVSGLTHRVGVSISGMVMTGGVITGVGMSGSRHLGGVILSGKSIQISSLTGDPSSLHPVQHCWLGAP